MHFKYFTQHARDVSLPLFLTSFNGARRTDAPTSLNRVGIRIAAMDPERQQNRGTTRRRPTNSASWKSVPSLGSASGRYRSSSSSVSPPTTTSCRQGSTVVRIDPQRARATRLIPISASTQTLPTIVERRRCSLRPSTPLFPSFRPRSCVIQTTATLRRSAKDSLHRLVDLSPRRPCSPVPARVACTAGAAPIVLDWVSEEPFTLREDRRPRRGVGRRDEWERTPLSKETRRWTFRGRIAIRDPVGMMGVHRCSRGDGLGRGRVQGQTIVDSI